MIFEASTALSSIKAAFDISKGMASLKSETEINLAVIEIQRILLEAQSASLADKQTIGELTDKMRNLQRTVDGSAEWENEKKRYILVKSELGTYTYDLNPDLSASETFHKLCSNCFEGGYKSILHTTRKARGGEIVHCPRCKSDFKLSVFDDVIASTPNLRYRRDYDF